MYLTSIDRPNGETLHRCSGCPVREHGLCHALDDDALTALRQIGKIRRLAEDAALFHAEDPVREVVSVVKGVLRLVQLLPDGRRQIAAFAFPGDFLGLTLSERHHFTVEAVTPAELCVVARPRFEAFVRDNACMAAPLYATAAQELAVAREHLVLLGRKTAQEKLSTFLLQMAERTPQHRGDFLRASLPMSRTDIADHLGLRIETVCRELAILKAADLVALESLQEALILNPEALEDRASGGFERD